MSSKSFQIFCFQILFEILKISKLLQELHDSARFLRILTIIETFKIFENYFESDHLLVEGDSRDVLDFSLEFLRSCEAFLDYQDFCDTALKIF